jgi:MFS family permease
MVRSAVIPPLRTDARFRRFWLGRLLANTAQNAILLALLVTVVNRTGSTIHSSLLVLSFIVPAAALGIFGGVAVDRVPKRGVLVLSSLGRAVLCLVFLRSSESVWIIYGTNLALSAVSQFSGPAESAVVPALVSGEQIASATALLNVGAIVAQVLGTVILAPLFLKTVGPDPLFFLTILLFLGAAVAYATIPRMRREHIGREDEKPVTKEARFRGLRGSASESWQLLRGNRSLFLAGVQQTLVMTTLIVLISLLPAFTRKVLGLPAEDAVFIFTPAALGVAIGNWLVPRLVRRGGKSTLAGVGFAIFLICLGGLGLSQPILHVLRTHSAFGALGRVSPGFFYSPAIVSAMLSAPLGFGYAIVLAGARLITYEHVPEEMQGRIFAFQGVLTSVASIVPLLLVGLLTTWLGPRSVLVIIAITDFLALMYARSMLRHGPGRRGLSLPGRRGNVHL